MERCAKIVLTSRRRGQLFSLGNPVVVAVRNNVLRAVPKAFWRRAIADSIKYDL
jgi:hypothetical protein